MSIASLVLVAMLESGMAFEDRRERERAAQQRVHHHDRPHVGRGRRLDAVTTRGLSHEIEYSQPVLYKHFTGIEQIAEAVAIDGFGDSRR